MATRSRIGRPHPVEALLLELIDSPEPVSFYDALAVVRRLRGAEPPEPILAGLIRLHDAPHATDGTRTILADYLRAVAQRQAYQRSLAEGPITLKAHGKTARARAGQNLELHLDERKGKGFRWEVVEQGRGVRCIRSRKSTDYPGKAIFEVSLTRTGTTRIELEEQPPTDVYGERDPKLEKEMRRFELTVIVEPRG